MPFHLRIKWNHKFVCKVEWAWGKGRHFKDILNRQTITIEFPWYYKFIEVKLCLNLLVAKFLEWDVSPQYKWFQSSTKRPLSEVFHIKISVSTIFIWKTSLSLCGRRLRQLRRLIQKTFLPESFQDIINLELNWKCKKVLVRRIKREGFHPTSHLFHPNPFSSKIPYLYIVTGH